MKIIVKVMISSFFVRSIGGMTCYVKKIITFSPVSCLACVNRGAAPGGPETRSISLV